MARVSERLRSAYRLGVQALWILLLVSIPVTSFPPLVDLVGGTPVAPLAMVPLAGLILFWLGFFTIGLAPATPPMPGSAWQSRC